MPKIPRQSEVNIVIHQIESLLSGNLLPPTIGRLQVSKRLIIERAWETYSSGEFALAYVGWEDEPNFFMKAILYMDFFLLIHALICGTPVTHIRGPANPISKLSELGKRRFYFSKYEKITVPQEDLHSELSKPILSTKDRFLQLEKDTQRIIDGHVGLALRYYYFALQANNRGRIEEVVIDLAIAAEALFSTRKNFTKNLKRRLSSFIADDESERGEIAKRIGDFYHLRGTIVHGGKKRINLNDIGIVSIYVQKAIDKALSFRLYSKKEFIQEVDKMIVT